MPSTAESHLSPSTIADSSTLHNPLVQPAVPDQYAPVEADIVCRLLPIRIGDTVADIGRRMETIRTRL